MQRTASSEKDVASTALETRFRETADQLAALEWRWEKIRTLNQAMTLELLTGSTCLV